VNPRHREGNLGDFLDQVRQGTLSGRPLYSALHLFGEAGYLEARSVIEFLWRGDHVAVAQLVDDFARYQYLPRLKNPSVLVGAVRDGLACLICAPPSTSRSRKPIRRACS